MPQNGLACQGKSIVYCIHTRSFFSEGAIRLYHGKLVIEGDFVD